MQKAALFAHSGVGDVIAFYCAEWKTRYRAEKSPPVTGKVAGQLKKLVEEIGSERARALIEAYLQMPDSWFVTKAHDIPTLITNLNKVSHFLDTGKLITRREVQRLDLEVTSENTLQAIRRGEV